MRDEWSTASLARVCGDGRLALHLDGVVLPGDREAWPLLHLHRRGLTVPDDVALVAYDDEEAADAVVPLTAVSPAKREIGRLAASTLLRRIARPDGGAPVRMMVQPAVRVRASTAPHCPRVVQPLALGSIPS
ncbi:substrate-binding domain-containing protein [Vibrio alginolyticus]